jgi:hypothetical protein
MNSHRLMLSSGNGGTLSYDDGVLSHFTAKSGWGDHKGKRRRILREKTKYRSTLCKQESLGDGLPH